jgi:DNA-binding CsgD family transcriptional regulator
VNQQAHRAGASRAVAPISSSSKLPYPRKADLVRLEERIREPACRALREPEEENWVAELEAGRIGHGQLDGRNARHYGSSCTDRREHDARHLRTAILGDDRSLRLLRHAPDLHRHERVREALERQVMELMALGKSSKEIAETLKISLRTVEGHRRVVLRKMGVTSAAHLASAIARLDRT